MQRLKSSITGRRGEGWEGVKGEGGGKGEREKEKGGGRGGGGEGGNHIQMIARYASTT